MSVEQEEEDTVVLHYHDIVLRKSVGINAFFLPNIDLTISSRI